jgi:hypothetical protein
MGSGGSGETTLHLIGGIASPAEGLVMVDGVDITSFDEGRLAQYRRERVGLTFRFFNLLPTLSAWENVEFAAEQWMKRCDSTVLEYAVLIAAGPEAVSGAVADPRSKLLWVLATRRVDLESDAPPALGASYQAAAGIGPLGFVFDGEVLGWVENRHVAYGTHSPWGAFKTEVNLEPQGAGAHMYRRMDYTLWGARSGPGSAGCSPSCIASVWEP